MLISPFSFDILAISVIISVTKFEKVSESVSLKDGTSLGEPE